MCARTEPPDWCRRRFETVEQALAAAARRPYRSLVLPTGASASRAERAIDGTVPHVVVERRGLDTYAALTAAGGDA